MPKQSRPSILLAMNWNDQRFYRGLVRYAKQAKWHLSAYLFDENFVPRGWPGDGAITCYGTSMADYIEALEIPVVDISFETLQKPVPRVRVDNEAVGRLAADHLIRKGFKHFAYFEWTGVPVNLLRGEAFFRALKEKGVSSEHIYTLYQTPDDLLGDWGEIQQNILGQLEMMPRPLAVFTGQDNLGATLIEVCHMNGIHVPSEIAVLGVDNTELLTESLQVTLSSIHTRPETMGYEAGKRLDQYMKGEIDSHAEEIKIQPTEVVQRQSTNILAVEHPAVQKGMSFILQNYAEPITLEEISQAAGLSKRGLEKAFLKTLNLTPAAELRRIRLDEAKKLLVETDEKIDAVAFACGYSNSSNLGFAFKRETGMTPKQYRDQFSKPAF